MSQIVCYQNDSNECIVLIIRIIKIYIHWAMEFNLVKKYYWRQTSFSDENKLNLQISNDSRF